MADHFVAIDVNLGGSCSRAIVGTDGIDALITAIGDDLDTTCDAALVVPAIDADVPSETAVEAIRTAVDAAIATVSTARTGENSGTVLLRYDTSLTQPQLCSAISYLLFLAQGGHLN